MTLDDEMELLRYAEELEARIQKAMGAHAFFSMRTFTPHGMKWTVFVNNDYRVFDELEKLIAYMEGISDALEAINGRHEAEESENPNYGREVD